VGQATLAFASLSAIPRPAAASSELALVGVVGVAILYGLPGAIAIAAYAFRRRTTALRALVGAAVGLPFALATSLFHYLFYRWLFIDFLHSPDGSTRFGFEPQDLSGMSYLVSALVFQVTYTVLVCRWLGAYQSGTPVPQQRRHDTAIAVGLVVVDIAFGVTVTASSHWR
jgi:hypothetical protein